MQAIVGVNQKNNFIVKKHKRVIGSIIKHKNIQQFNKSMRWFSSSSCSIDCCWQTTTTTTTTEDTTTFMDTMEPKTLSSSIGEAKSVTISTQLNGEYISLSRWHRQLESKASPVRGEIFSFPVYTQEEKQQLNLEAQTYATYSYGDLTRVDTCSANSSIGSSQYQKQQYHLHSTDGTITIINGVFGEPTRTNTTIADPSLAQWPSCSMFMGATEHWPSGFSNESYTIGEQLNTPRPEDVCGFEFGSFSGLGASEAKVNLANVFSTNSITDRIEGDCNNNRNNKPGRSMHDRKEQTIKLKYDNNRSPMTPPSSNRDETTLSPGFNSWEFEPCLEGGLLSPASIINTPLRSVASPDGSSGDTEHKPDELETCVDFIFSPDTVIDGSEMDDVSIPLHEEIEQLSNSFYCKSNSLVSINASATNVVDIVSPSFLKLLQEESSFPSVQTVVSTAKPIATQSNHPSIVNSFFSDADDDDDDDDELNVKRKRNRKDERSSVAAARSQAALQIVESKFEIVDVIKTQTQQEHNYTIKLPNDGESQDSLINSTVKETILSHREPTARSTQPPTVADGEQKKPCSRINENMPQRQYLPKLKLKIVNPVDSAVTINSDPCTLTTTHMVIQTPELTNDLLDLEAENLKQENDEFDLLEYITSGTDYDIVCKSPIEEKPTVSIDESIPVVAAPATTTKQSTICGATLSDLFNPAKRKLPSITIENLEELTASTNGNKRFRSATSSTTSSVYGDNASETSSTRPVKRRGRPPKPVSSIRDRSEYQHLSEADMRYREQRDKNNEASRKSRINRKDRELRLEGEARELNRQYAVLINEEKKIIKECARWRKAVMRLALL
ncbi:uncharacterized protein LOC131428496 [Malaya genurostris]|uniref:uncharacterized protein LOC131428496 n=1 Tax=Malaya genurostris TaxID=325434 RepID=UPI0026F3DD09|nr:uncharacterized protein LOC131428496 [Malaya genurostris]